VQDPGIQLANVLTLGSRVFLTFVSTPAGNGYRENFTCFDTTTSGLCGTPGTFPKDDGGAPPNVPYADFVAPVLSAAGPPLGACDVFLHKCWDPTGTALPDPYPGFSGFGFPPAGVGFGSGAIVGPRFYAGDVTTGRIDCFDFGARVGTGAVPACSGFTGPSNASNYTVRALANLPGCMAADGDAAQITVFDAVTGGACAAASAQTSVNLSTYYCDGQSHAQSWGHLKLNGLNGTEYGSATLTLTGKNGPVPGFTNLVLAPGQTSIDLSSIPVTGNTSSLTAQITMTGVNNQAKVSAATLTLDWQGDPIEVCFSTHVGRATCSSSVQVSNDANAVTDAGAGGTDAPGGNDSGTAKFNVANDPNLCVDLGVTKTGTDQAPPGGALSWSFTVTNNGPADSSGYTVVDTLPGGVTNIATSSPGCSVSGSAVTCTEGPLAIGGSQTFTVTGKAPDPFPSAITNSVTVTGNDSDTNANNNTATWKTIPSQPSVSIVKSATVSPASDQGGVKVGDVISYSYTVKNTGNVALKTVSVSDPTLGSVSCPSLDPNGLAVGASVTCTADAQHVVTQADVDAGVIVDTATAGCTDVTGGACSPSQPSTVTVPGTPPHPTVSIQKIAHASGGDTTPIKVGDTISYTYVVTNTGNVTESSVSVNDPTVGSVTCPTPASPGLAPGDSITCTADNPHTVTQSDVDSGQVTDTATAGCSDVQNDSCPPSQPSGAGVPSDPEPRVAIVKTASVNPPADQVGVKVGDTISYSYKVTNVGNVTLASVSVSDPSIGTVNCPTPSAPGLAPGGSVTCASNSPHTVTQADADSGSVTDTATAGCSDTQGKACPPSNPSTVTVPGTDPKPSVSVVKSASVNPAADQNAAKVGDTVSYSYKVTNTGNVTLPTVSVDDPTIGSVTCPTPPSPGLAPGDSVTCTANNQHTVTQADVDAGKIVDTATADCADTRGLQCPPSGPSKVTVPTAPASPSVTIQKSATVSPSADQNAVQVGDLISYSYKVTNTGNVTLASVSVDDPALGQVDCPTPAPPGLAPGDSITCTGHTPHLVTQSDFDAGQVADSATAGCKDVQGNSCTPSPPSRVTVPAAPENESVSIQKIADASAGDQTPIFVGETIQYSYLVTNTGNVTLKTVSVSDSTAGSVTCPTPVAPGLAPGQSEPCKADAVYTVTQSDVNSGSVTDTATAGCTDTHNTACAPSQPSTVKVPSSPAPAVAIDKKASVDPSADQNDLKAGDLISYSYVVTNVGNTTVQSVSVNDPSIGSVTCPDLGASGLAPGHSVTCTADAVHVVKQSDVDSGGVSDTATAGCTDVTGKACAPSTPSTVVVPSIPNPHVRIVKSATVVPSADQSGYKLGDKISYSYVVTNVGNTTLQSVSVTDPTIGSVTCPTPAAPGLAPGQSETCTADSQHTVTQADVDAGKIVDTATAGCKDVTGVSCPPSDPSTVTVPATPPAPGVSIHKSGVVSPSSDQNNIKVGDTISYSYLVTNTGNVTLKTVSVSDPSDGSVTCPTPAPPGLAPGASITCTADQPHTVTQSDVDDGAAKDIATASCADTNGNPCPDSPPSQALVPADPNLSVSIVKSASVEPASDQNLAKVGDRITYTYKVTNTGNVDLKFVQVSDPTLGPVSCPIPAPPGLAPGASETCTGDLQHVVSQADAQAGKVTDTATASGTDNNGHISPPSDPSTVTIKVQPPNSKLLITKTVNHKSATLGQKLTYTITVTNQGPADAQNVVVTDNPSIAMKVLGVQPSQGTCKHGPPLTCDLGTLKNGQQATIKITAEPTRSGTERNTATVGFAGGGTIPSGAATTHVTGTLKLKKTASRRTASPGQNITYTLKVTNPTTIAIGHVKVCDKLPAGLLYLSASPNARFDLGSYCWTVGQLKPHRSKTYTITVNAAPGKGGNQVNHATASGRGVKPAHASATVHVTPARPIPCASASSVRRKPGPPTAHIAC
jgi:uncharacterized repeat protein (TIGR01451 family)